MKLKYEQNTFSLRASSINYDYPSNILYSWRLEGFYDEWTTPSSNGLMRFTNIPSGKYMLHVRSVSNEEKYKSYEQRSMLIIISPPLWATPWAIAGYIMLAVLVCVILFRIITLRKQKRISEEKDTLFINTAHDIRTPLTLIKAPLEELRNKDMVNEEGKGHVSMALRNVDVLLRLITNLINFERINTYSSHMYIAEYELGTYMSGICDPFHAYANIKHIRLTYESNFQYLNVWFDRDKMDSIMKNILSNAMKYTPENGNIYVSASEYEDGWGIEVKDTGIGIPRNEQKGLFHTYFRGSNAINLRVSGSGIGLALVHRLVRLHGGKITIESTAEQGTLVRIIFPKGNKHFRKASIISATRSDLSACRKLLLRRFLPLRPNSVMLLPSASSSWKIMTICVFIWRTRLVRIIWCSPVTTERRLFEILPEFKPNLVLSDIMMPEMSGDELCAAIKGNIETSHIPVLLLTALGDEKNMLEGLKIGADDYMAKPFSISILKASVNRLISNRILLHKKYGSLNFETEKWPKGCRDTLDWKFIASVRENVEKNMADPDFTVDMLCSLHHMSRSSFYNKVKALTDCSPADYVRLIRMQYAARMLKEGEHSITEIADMTGFCDAKYFREVFRKHFGVSPSEYRGKGTAEKDNSDLKQDNDGSVSK